LPTALLLLLLRILEAIIVAACLVAFVAHCWPLL
jgi:hypothetical protein